MSMLASPLRAMAAATVAATLVFAIPPASARPAPQSFSDLVEKVRPAVVNIAIEQRTASGSRGSSEFQVPPGLRGTPFEEFLRRFMQPPGTGEPDNDRGPRGMALGSGFIVNADGYVVTNSHVVRESSKVTVTLHDGRKFDAKVVGRDDKTDIALVKVETDRPLPFVTWGDSDATKVGDWILAVGNPFGLGGTVTAGIVSARGRDIQSGPFDDYLQIDAPINRGNSGGPSFNMAGEVVGINTAIYSPNGGSIGIGFAIPSSLAKPIVAELRSKGYVERGWLGVTIQPMTGDIAESLGLPRGRGDGSGGALVVNVAPHSPAAKAGLRQGDVIRSVDGKPVAEFKDLARLVAAAGPNARARLVVWREGREQIIAVALGRMPEDQTAAANDSAPQERPEAAAARSLGAALAPVTREARQRFGFDESAKGAVVVDVRRGSAGAETGLMPGDLIVKVGDRTVSGPRDVVDAVQAASRQNRSSVLLLVARQGSERFVAVRLGREMG
jgi:serine protease Do